MSQFSTNEVSKKLGIYLTHDHLSIISETDIFSKYNSVGI